MLDSGADISAIPHAIAEFLDLDLTGDMEFAYEIGGKVRYVETDAKIQVQKGHEKYTFNVPVKVILDEYNFPILLSRLGFFSKFVVTFDEENEKVTLKKIIGRSKMNCAYHFCYLCPKAVISTSLWAFSYGGVV